MAQDPASTQVKRDAWQKLAQACAQGAIYNSAERLPHSKCLPGTRIDLNEALRELVDDDTRKIIWVSGESGSGKSTVAHSLADELRQEGRLVGTFFFSRKHTKRSTLHHVFATLAYQIGLLHDRARDAISKVIVDDPALLSPEKSHVDLLEKLVIQPLKELSRIWEDRFGVSIILDALDEGTGSGTDHLKPFILLLDRLIHDRTLPIDNIIITSRPWPQIKAVMNSIDLRDVVKTLHVGDYDSRDDVALFFRHAFDQIYDDHDLIAFCPKPWPPEADLTMLCERAGGRFIFAATIVRLLDQSNQPLERLPLVCSMLRGNVARVWGNIDHLYTSIINDVDETTRSTGLRYLSLIVSLAEPLRVPDLHQFLGVTDIHSSLLPFSALVSIPSTDSPDPVQVYHTSFRDFLLNRHEHDQTRPFRLHHHLSCRCFRTMAMLLKRDICGIQDPSLIHDEIPEFAKRRAAIPRALRYACLHWLHHLQQVVPDEEVQELLLDFVENRILYAIEAYAVLGELVVGVELFRSARKTITTTWPASSFPRKDDAVALLYDSWRLTLEFFNAISSSALHVYESALPCSPAKSLIRDTYRSVLAEASTFVFEEGLDDRWDCVTRVIEMEDVVYDFSASPDGSQVACLFDSSVGVWDTASGVLVASISRGFSTGGSRPLDPTIVHGGDIIAFLCTDGCSLWRPTTGSLVPLHKPSNQMPQIPLAFSHGGTMLACRDLRLDLSVTYNSETTTVRIYDVRSCEQISQVSFDGLPQYRERLAAHFSLKDDRLLLHYVTHASGGNLLIVDPIHGKVTGHIQCCEAEWHLFGPNDDQILHVTASSWRTGSPATIFSSSITQTSITPTASSSSTDTWLGSRSEAKRRQLNQLLHKADEKTEDSDLREICEIGEPVQINSLSYSYAERSRTMHTPSGKTTGVLLGNKISSLLSDRGSRSTNWKSSADECFGVVPEREQVWVIDLVQAAHQDPFLSRQTIQTQSIASVSRSMSAENHKFLCESDNGDLEVYEIEGDNGSRAVVVTETLTGRPLREIILGPSMGQLEHAKISPRSKFLFLVGVDSIFPRQTRTQLWNLTLGDYVGTPEGPYYGENITDIRFAADETFVVYPCHNDCEPLKLYVLYVQETTMHQGELKPPLLRAQTRELCKLSSVANDTVEFWGCDLGDKSLVRHLQWRRGSSTVTTIASLPRVKGELYNQLYHSPNSSRVYLHCLGLRAGFYAMNTQSPRQLCSQGSADPGEEITYEIDKDSDPLVAFDTISWSDLCLDQHGWLRKRRRRICWLPMRYRPKHADHYGLWLRIDGQRVTIATGELREPEKHITLRLLNTEIDYYD